MKTYSDLRHEDVLRLVPAFKDALADRDHVDTQALKAAMKQFIDGMYEKAGGIVEGEAFKTFQRTNDPKALATVLNQIDSSMSELSRFLTLMHVGGQHFPDKELKLLPVFEQATAQMSGTSGYLNQCFSDIISYVAQQGREKTDAMIREVPELARFAPLLERCHTAPKPDMAKINALPSLLVEHGVEPPQGENDKEKEQFVFARGLARTMNHRIAMAEAMGFADTQAMFAFQNVVPGTLMKDFTDAANGRLETLMSEMAALKKVGEKKFSGSRLNYSWDEAKDIVSSAYERLSPECGKLARRALDEGWLQVSQHGGNPHTIQGIPASEDAAGHPFAFNTFNGGGLDVLMLGHEMAHVISNYVSGSKNSALLQGAPLIVQESYSHLGEALVLDEMQRRAKDPEQKIKVKMLAAAKEFDALTIIPFAKMEAELYALVKQNPKPGFAAMNEVCRRNVKPIADMLEMGADINQIPMLWNMVNQPSHTIAVYPITKIMASALHEKFKQDPKGFSKAHQEAMEAGGALGLEGLWKKLLGKDAERPKELTQQRLDAMLGEVRALKAELAEMPDMPKKSEQPEGLTDAQPKAQAPATELSGYAKGLLHKRMASPAKPKDSWAQGAAEAPPALRKR